ncbi:MAG: hypothetical protein ABH873_01110 [Candidatus Firestonebacteria bacterium]
MINEEIDQLNNKITALRIETSTCKSNDRLKEIEKELNEIGIDIIKLSCRL